MSEIEAIRERHRQYEHDELMHDACQQENADIATLLTALTAAEARAEAAKALIRVLDETQAENERLKQLLGEAHGNICSVQRLIMQMSKWSDDAEESIVRAQNTSLHTRNLTND